MKITAYWDYDTESNVWTRESRLYFFSGNLAAFILSIICLPFMWIYDFIKLISLALEVFTVIRKGYGKTREVIMFPWEWDWGWDK